MKVLVNFLFGSYLQGKVLKINTKNIIKTDLSVFIVFLLSWQRNKEKEDETRYCKTAYY